MSRPQQRRLFPECPTVDILPIENREESALSSAPLISSSRPRRANRENKSMEALQAYGEESPSPPPETEMEDEYSRLRSAKVPSPPLATHIEPQSAMFERMKIAEPPRPPSPNENTDGSEGCDADTFNRLRAARVPSPPQLSDTEIPERIEHVRSPSPGPATESDLFERLRRVKVPSPPSADVDEEEEVDWDTFRRLQAARVPSPPEAISEEVEDERSPSPGLAAELDLYERLRSAKVPSPPLADDDEEEDVDWDTFRRLQVAWVPSPPEAISEEVEDERSPSPGLAAESDLYERLRSAKVPSPPLADDDDDEDVDWDTFRRLQAARVPTPPEPCDIEASQPMEDVRAASPSGSALFERMRMAEVPPAPTALGKVEGEGEDRADSGRPINFGEPERGQIRQFLAKSSTWELPTLDEVADMQRMSLASCGTSDDVLRVLAEFKSRHSVDTAPSNFPPNQQLDRPIFHAMKRIACDICEAAKMRVTRVTEGQYTVDMIDVLEVVRHPHTAYLVEPYCGGPHYPSRQALIEMGILYMGCHIECAAINLLGRADVSEWPEEWFSNISMDLKELDHLVLVSVSRQSPPPPLPACYHAYLRWKDDPNEFQNELRHIPHDSFRLLDSISDFIPNWSPHLPDKYGGFAFPWWLHGASTYYIDFQRLRGAKILESAAEYFQHARPLNQPSFTGRLDNMLEDEVGRYMTHLTNISNEIVEIDGRMDHLFSRWVALQKLVGTPDVS
ncbi:hypothetical protein EDD15DRAFT_2201054 [Pisolithus albus]|nr:hypothetical protein EDD15DRAFT_2201054 [Pisolithus albus]